MSDYFERVEAQLLDAVEREAMLRRGASAWRLRLRLPGGRRQRGVALATATALCVLVACVVALALSGSDGRDDVSLAPAGSLPAQLEVLRRPQQPGDAPPSVIAAARAGAATTRAPYTGTVDAAGVRRLAEVAGHRLYLAPLVGGQVALAILTDAADRPVQRPYGLTSELLRSGAFYILYGVRAAGNEPKDLRMLQLQLVPDGITRIDYRFPAVPFIPGRRETRGEAAAVTQNAAAVVLRGHEVGGPPSEIVLRDAAGRVAQTRTPSEQGSGPVAPEEVCQGVELPREPRRWPGGGRERLHVRTLCERMGLPQQAHRLGPGLLALRYGDRVYWANGGTIGGIQGRRPGDPFPPPLVREVPSTAAKLPR